MKKNLVNLFIILLFSACQHQGPRNEASTSTEEEEIVEPELITFSESEGIASNDRNFYFLFDVSGSMDDFCSSDRKIDGAKAAIYKFLEKVPDDVNIGLLFLGIEDEDGIEEMVPLGKNNKENFKNALATVEPQDGTPLCNATYWGMNRLVEQYKKQLGYGEYRLIIITDGLASLPDDFAARLKELKKYPFIALYGIGLCIEENSLLQANALSYTDAYDYNELGKALEKTISELENFDPTEFDELVESENQ